MSNFEKNFQSNAQPRNLDMGYSTPPSLHPLHPTVKQLGSFLSGKDMINTKCDELSK